MSTKNCIRIIVAAAILAWPGVEAYRYWVAQKQLVASFALQERVTVKLAQMKNAQPGSSKVGHPTMPVNAPASAQPSSPSSF